MEATFYVCRTAFFGPGHFSCYPKIEPCAITRFFLIKSLWFSGAEKSFTRSRVCELSALSKRKNRTDRLANRQTDRQADRQTGRLSSYIYHHLRDRVRINFNDILKIRLIPRHRWIHSMYWQKNVRFIYETRAASCNYGLIRRSPPHWYPAILNFCIGSVTHECCHGIINSICLCPCF